MHADVSSRRSRTRVQDFRAGRAGDFIFSDAGDFALDAIHLDTHTLAIETGAFESDNLTTLSVSSRVADLCDGWLDFDIVAGRVIEEACRGRLGVQRSEAGYREASADFSLIVALCCLDLTGDEFVGTRECRELVVKGAQVDADIVNPDFDRLLARLWVIARVFALKTDRCDHAWVDS